MFRNQTKLQLDEKGRIRLPQAFDCNFGYSDDENIKNETQPTDNQSLIVTLHNRYYEGHYKCLVIYSLSSWVQLERSISNLQDDDIHGQRLKNNFLGCMQECQIKSGKILLSPFLREQANIKIKDSVYMQWDGNKYILWNLANKQKFDDYINQQSSCTNPSKEVNSLPF